MACGVAMVYNGGSEGSVNTSEAKYNSQNYVDSDAYNIDCINHTRLYSTTINRCSSFSSTSTSVFSICGTIKKAVV